MPAQTDPNSSPKDAGQNRLGGRVWAVLSGWFSCGDCERKDRDPKDISNPAAKFLIGLIAAASGYLAPLFVPLLTEGDISHLSVLRSSGMTGSQLLLLGLAWCALIGIALMWFEWCDPKRPGDSFMKAFGIPAALVGALATAGQSLDKVRSVDASQEVAKASRDAAVEIASGRPGTATAALLDQLSPEQRGRILGAFVKATITESPVKGSLPQTGSTSMELLEKLRSQQ